MKLGMGPQLTIEPLFAAIKEACLPGVWSKGIALSRGTLVPDQVHADEVIIRVLAADRPVHPKVTLWPKDGDWYCDCGDRNDPCHHIAAAVIALKAGLLDATQTAEKAAPRTPAALQVVYRFQRYEKTLRLERHLLRNPGAEMSTDDFSAESLLRSSLVAHVGGIQAGRITSIPVAASQGDYGVDRILSSDSPSWPALLRALENCSHLFLDGKPIRASGRAVSLQAQLTDEGKGFRLKAHQSLQVDETFTLQHSTELGVALCGETLRPIEDSGLSTRERELLMGAGTLYHDAHLLVTEIIPTLQRKISLDIQTTRLPVLAEIPPRMTLKLEKHGSQTLIVVPEIFYDTKPGQVPKRDPAAERLLARTLQNELNLYPDQMVRFEAREAVEFTQKLHSLQEKGFEVKGNGFGSFFPASLLTPQLHADEMNFDLNFFESPNFGASTQSPATRQADAGQVFRAWRENQSVVPLLGGGWAKLPIDWLDRYGERIEALLAARNSSLSKKLPKCLLPELTSLCAENDLKLRLSDGLRKLVDSLERHEKIPASRLPQDLQAKLRTYQVQGVHWLYFLRDAGLGALLADDMGLGKTLQALCAIPEYGEQPQGSTTQRTLIVCPTSVLQSWMDQIRQFRPKLRVMLYHGAERSLPSTESSPPVVLTSYGVLRMDRQKLCDEHWNTVILDESQTIKNPDSQIAQAAHALNADFRLALTGTPIENRIDDLWSQFRFLNPELLGDRQALRDVLGDSSSSRLTQLKAKTRPFILRRLKRDVAPELPPRTEVVLHCELNPNEAETYQALLATSKKEVLKKIEEGGSVFAALEMLLRLRQTCCHLALVPGSQAASTEVSSKLELLLGALGDSLMAGHRALIFSQWTSYLDIVEHHLKTREISLCRLDGSTRDRGAVVAQFQDPQGPSVMLISLKAGGTGLTLTAADHVFILDPWWNPAVEDQAADRAHRIGQTQPVLIHRLVAKDTVEDRILSLQKTKKELAANVLGTGSTNADGAGSEMTSTLTREDLLALLT